MTELLFLVEPDPEGGYTARAVGPAIYTQAETLDELEVMVRDAVNCHFEERERPKVLRLHIAYDRVLAA